MNKEDIEDILIYDIIDNNDIFVLEKGNRTKTVGFTMRSQNDWDRSTFHSQDSDIIEGLLRLRDIGVPILAEIKYDRPWVKKSEMVPWSTELVEWCYSIKIPY